MGGRWQQRELFQPKFEDGIKIPGIKNIAFFKVFGMRSEEEKEIWVDKWSRGNSERSEAERGTPRS